MLKIWLPLIKNVNNQGLEISEVTNTGATVSTSGPLGGSYSFNGSSNRIQSSYLCQESELTVCM